MFFTQRGYDVRDVNPNRTAEQSRRRRQGKTDNLDSVRVARETQTDPDMPVAFKRAGGESGPDETSELLALWHKARRSVLTSRQHLLNEAESLLCELPEAVRADLPDTTDVRARLRVLAAGIAVRPPMLPPPCASARSAGTTTPSATSTAGKTRSPTNSPA